jgi:hypothetical protein
VLPEVGALQQQHLASTVFLLVLSVATVGGGQRRTARSRADLAIPEMGGGQGVVMTHHFRRLTHKGADGALIRLPFYFQPASPSCSQ